jgi:hypothetical protein
MNGATRTSRVDGDVASREERADHVDEGASLTARASYAQTVLGACYGHDGAATLFT